VARQLDGIALGTILAGSVSLYAGLKGYSLPHALQSLVQGKAPTVLANQITGTTPAAGSGGGSSPPASGSYSHSQLMGLWRLAGGSAASAQNAACHAIQESGGNPLVTSPNPDGGTNVGLWQLDTPGGKGAGYSISNLQDPVTNARAAVAGSSDGTDWTAWATPGC